MMRNKYLLKEYKMLSQDLIQTCIQNCSKAYNQFQGAQMNILIKNTFKHLDKFQTVPGFNALLDAKKNNDFLGIIKAVNQMMESKETIPLIVSLLDDVKKTYASNKTQLKNLVNCYISNCSPKHLEIIKEFIVFYKNIVSLILEPTINNKLKEILAIIVGEFAYSLKHINDSMTSKSAPNKSTRSKSAPVRRPKSAPVTRREKRKH